MDNSYLAAKQRDQQLLANIKAILPALENLLEEVNAPETYEDRIYRFYYHSFKVYELPGLTQEILKLLRAIAPEGRPFCQEFQEILATGTTEKPDVLPEPHHWSHHTRPLVEAFLHAKFFLEMAVKYGNELAEAPDRLPFGWAALLCLYGIR